MKSPMTLSIALTFLLYGYPAAQPPIIAPQINIQRPPPVRAHGVKEDARNTRDTTRPAPPAQTTTNSSNSSPPPAKAPQIHRASADGQVESVTRALEDDPNLVRSKDGSGYTALHHAAIGGHVEVVEVLLESGAGIDGIGSRGETALLLASSKGNYQVVRLLTEKGADPNKASADGKTPLHKAAMVGSAEAVDALLAAGADPSTKDRSGRTALELAERYRAGDSQKVVKSLEAATD
jgi:ankyrin repeat protein